MVILLELACTFFSVTRSSSAIVVWLSCGSVVENLPAVQEMCVQSLGWEDPLGKGMATHCSILAWRIPMDRGAWRATVHGVAESQTRLSTTQQPIHISVDKEENTMENIHKPLKLLVFTHNLTLSKFLAYLFFS